MRLDNAMALCLNFEETPFGEWDFDDEIPDNYWNAAQRPLAVSVSLLQQGMEFLLKAKICQTSPMLLLEGSARNWPRNSSKENIQFSKFKTIDAQDLVSVRDTVAPVRLPSSFRDFYERVRNRRNTVMHSIDVESRFAPNEIIVDILEASHVLIENENWMDLRENYHINEPGAILNGGFIETEPYLAREALYLAKALGRKELNRYFDYDKKARKYLCNHCNHASADWDLEVRIAQLRPNSPQSESVYCFSCRQEYAVVREQCGAEGCAGNVIDCESAVCLTCGIEK